MARIDHVTMFYEAVKLELIDTATSVQVGIRTCNADTLGVHIINTWEVEAMGAAAVAQKSKEILGFKPTYLSFYIDFLDPAFAPGTGTPSGENCLRGKRLQFCAMFLE